MTSSQTAELAEAVQPTTRSPMVDNKRAFPRVHLDFPVTIRTVKGETHRSTGRDVSRGGLRIEAETALVRGLFRDDRISLGRASHPVLLRFPLRVDGESVTIRAKARLAHFDRNVEDNYVLGFQFEAFGNGSYAKLERFIVESLRY